MDSTWLCDSEEGGFLQKFEIRITFQDSTKRSMAYLLSVGRVSPGTSEMSGQVRNPSYNFLCQNAVVAKFRIGKSCSSVAKTIFILADYHHWTLQNISLQRTNLRCDMVVNWRERSIFKFYIVSDNWFWYTIWVAFDEWKVRPELLFLSILSKLIKWSRNSKHCPCKDRT